MFAYSEINSEESEGKVLFTVPGDSGGLPGLGGGDGDGRVPQRHRLPGPRVPAVREQPGDRVSRLLRPRPHHGGRDRLLAPLPHQPGQRGDADRREPRRHHLARPARLDLDDTLRVHRQAGLARAPRHRLLRPRHAPLGLDRQEEQVHQRRPLLRLDARHCRHAHQQVLAFSFINPLISLEFIMGL